MTRPLLIIFLTIFVNLIGFGIIVPLLPFYAETFGASPFTVLPAWMNARPDQASAYFGSNAIARS